MIRLPHLNWPQRAAIVAGLTIFALVGGMERADAIPLMQHTAAAGFTNVTCLDSGAWSATLNVTATNPELNPRATISNPSSPFTVAVPYTHTWTFESTTATYTVGVHIVWSDGFKQDQGPFTATRPEGCTPPTTQPGTTTTTTCTQAIPPRTDCEATTSPSPSTTTPAPPPPTSTSLVPPAPSVAGSPTSGAPRPRPSANTSATSTKPINLPATGTDGKSLALAAAGFGAVGVALVTVTRRRKRS